MTSLTALLVVHVLADVVWIGALLSVAVLVAHAPWTADPADVGRLARRIYVRLAVPAFLVSFGAGVARIALAPEVYAHAYWLHAKLTFALAIIVLHHVIGGRAKRVAQGRTGAAAGVDFLGIAVFLCAGGAILFAVTKSLPWR